VYFEINRSEITLGQWFPNFSGASRVSLSVHTDNEAPSLSIQKGALLVILYYPYK